MTSNLLQDIRFGWRQLRENSGFTIVATLTLALGIAASTAVFSVVNEHLLRPLPYNKPERIVALWDVNRKGPSGNREQVAYLNFLDWRKQNQVFEEMAAFTPGDANYSGDGEPRRIEGLSVSEGYFRVLGVQPQLGRTFLPEECDSDISRVVVLGHAFWQTELGGRTDVLGSSIRLDGFSHTVVGVMPPECSGLFVFLGRRYAPELWTPLTPTRGRALRGNHSWFAIARLKPGLTLDRAQADMNVIARRLEEQYPDSNADWDVQVANLQEAIFGSTRPVLLCLLAAVGMVLLIACINVANLVLVRASRRGREVAIRTALGATRLRIVRQMLTESLMLSLFGGAAGLLLALWVVDSLNGSVSGGRFIFSPIQFDGRVLAFGFLVSVTTTFLVGLIPALRASRTDLNETLKETGKSSSQALSRHPLTRMLVAGEIALSLVLLIGAGLLVDTFTRLWKVDLGFRSDKVLTMQVIVSRARYPDFERAGAFFSRLLERIETLPGVAAAGMTSSLPLHGASATNFIIEGQAWPKPGEWPIAGYMIATPHYFTTLNIPLQRGRYFTEQDERRSEKVVMISASLARRYWGDKDPVGRQLWQPLTGAGEWCTVVGVLGDVRQDGLEQESRPMIYLPGGRMTPLFMSLVVRTNGDPLAGAAAIRKEVTSLDPDQPVFAVRTMEDVVSDYLAGRQLVLTLIGCFALVALLLAVVGIYSVISYLVTERTREIGIRMALGARRGEVMRMVVGQGMVLVLCGVGAGVLISMAVTDLLSGQLYGVTPTDPRIFAQVAALLLIVSLGACYFPARRATRIEPTIALRCQ